MCSKWIFICILFSAVSGRAACVSHQYHFVNVGKNWSEAQSFCRKTYTDLATITSKEEMKALMKRLSDKAKGYAWIGLENLSWSWRWSLKDNNVYLDSDKYQNWRTGEPNNYKGNEQCAIMDKSNGKWIDVSCNAHFYFACFEERNKTYVLIRVPMTWPDAQSYCRKYHTDLAFAMNQTENQKIQNLLQNNTYVWIGLVRDSWKWSDQSNSSFRYWRSDQPDNDGGKEDCAEISTADGQWYDGSCTQKLPFICYGNKLILINKNLTWREALSYCTVNHDDLVSVYTAEIQSWVMDVAQNASTAHVWLGLSYTYNMGFWYWVNGLTLDYHNWAPRSGTGGEVCSNGKQSGAMQSRGKQQWVSRPETEKLNFICTTN